MDTIEEERAWEWYLAFLSNPRTEIISFNEFKKQFLGTNQIPAEIRQRKKGARQPSGMTEQQVNAQVAVAQRQLKLLPSPDKMKKERGNHHG